MEVKHPTHWKTFLIAFLACSVAASFYIYDFVLRTLPQAMTQNLMDAFKIQAGRFGLLSSLFFWGYAPMQIPVGILFDRFNARLLLTFTVLFSSLATLGFAYTETYSLALIFRLIMGVTTSFAFVGALVVGMQWFKRNYFAMYTGLVQFLGCVGAIIGITPVSYFLNYYSWRTVSLWIAIIGCLLAVLTWFFVRDVPKSTSRYSWALHLEHYRAALLNSQTWFVAIFGFAIWSPVTIFAVLWGMPYLENIYHLSKVTAATQISIIWITIAFGGPLVGWTSKKIGKRRLPMILCSLTGLIASAILVYSEPLSSTFLIFLLILYGIGASGLVLAFGLVADIQSPKTIGAAIGFTNMAVILGGIIFQPTVGYIIQNVGPLYSHHSFRIGLTIIPLSFLLALVISFLITETNCMKKY